MPTIANAATTHLTVYARAADGSDFSKFHILVDGKVVESDRVTKSTVTPIVFTLDGLDDGVGHQIGVQHYHDTGSRALTIERIDINSKTIDASTGVQDVGPLDGEALKSGLTTIEFNGTLLFDVKADMFGDAAGGTSEPEPSTDESVPAEPTEQPDTNDEPGAAGDTASIVLTAHKESGSDFSKSKLFVDGGQIGDFRFTSSSPTQARFDVAGLNDGDGHLIEVYHYHDKTSRALHIDGISVNAESVPLSDGIQDVGPRDDKNIVSGGAATTIEYNGAFVLDVAANYFGGSGSPAPEPVDSGPPDVETPPSPPATALDGFPALPQPLANLRIYHLNPSGSQKVSGPGDQDLLIVAPDRPITGTFKLDVDGFRGVFWIGGSLNPQPMGTLVTPNSKTVQGVGTLVKIRTHSNPVSRPFIVMARLHLETDNITFGDFLQLGGDTTAGDWQAWPDVYRCRIIAEELYGWSGYYGGSFSNYVSHSDFTKFETGGVRHSYAARIRVDWGYQAEYVLPSHASDKKPYAGPDGHGSAHYWDYVLRAVENPEIKSKDNPKVLFLARSSDEVEAGNHISYTFHDEGKGNYLIPADGSNSMFDHIHPGGGAFKPTDKGDYVVWPSASGRPFVTGKLMNGKRVNVPTVVSPSEVGYQHRVTNRAELVAALGSACH